MIFFDLDGTLMDHAGAEAAALARFAADLSMTADPDFAARWAAASERYMRRYLDGELSFAQQRRARVAAALGEELPDAQADALFDRYLGAYERNWRLFADVRPALDALVAYKLGVITNGASAQQRQKIETLGLSAYFSCVVISEQAGVAKPQPEIFWFACRTAGVAPSRACYVGDRLEDDAQAALRAGFGRAVHIDRRGGTKGRRGQVAVIPDLYSLPQVLDLSSV